MATTDAAAVARKPRRLTSMAKASAFAKSVQRRGAVKDMMCILLVFTALNMTSLSDHFLSTTCIGPGSDLMTDDVCVEREEKG